MVVLSQSLISPSSGKPYSDPEAVPPELVHNSSLHLTFAKYCHSANTVSVPHKDKFISFFEYWYLWNRAGRCATPNARETLKKRAKIDEMTIFYVILSGVI